MSAAGRVVITLDAVGGVGRYATDLAGGLAANGVACLLAAFGPRGDLAVPPGVELVWTDAPLDWTVEAAAQLDTIPGILTSLAERWRADLLHLNLPSQAAGMPPGPAIVAVSHSCLPSWWEAVRGTTLPPPWHWQSERNREGLARADIVLAPSRSHAQALQRCYGALDRLRVVPNATEAVTPEPDKQPLVLAAGRWWDEGKGAAVLDEAARLCPWPVLMAGSLEAPDGTRRTLAHARALGTLSRQAVESWMRSAAIFASPSLYEPFGLAVLEAASHGAALVLSDIPTFREFWSNAALFAAPGDADGLARAIARLAHDPALRESLARNARAVAATLDPKRQLDGVLDAYAAALRCARSAA